MSVLVESVTLVYPDELTESEEQQRLWLERKVERAFYEAGKALMELRDKRLYRSMYKTFEEYCVHRFGHTRQKSNYLIAAAIVYENLTTNCCQKSLDEDLTTNQAPPLPTSEGQIRALFKLEPAQQIEVWEQAVEESGGKVPSGRQVKDIVERVMQRTKVPNPYREKEVCLLIAKDNPDLRGKAGCWCIVQEVHDYSCTVTTWDGTYTLKIDHLKSLNYLDYQCEQIESLYNRIKQILKYPDLEQAAWSALKQLGEIRRPYLTELEEVFLSAIEKKYNPLLV